MGLFDKLAGDVLKSFTSNKGLQDNLLGSITQMLTDQNAGGLAGLVQMFKDKGLGDVMASWVSTGKNLPIGADQITQVLGSAQVQQIAAQLGLSSGDASKALAQFLPQVVDKLTPNGSLPTEDVLAQGLNALKGKIFG